MPTIDGDAHVMEGPQTWEYCDPSERKFMPVPLIRAPADRQFWLSTARSRPRAPCDQAQRLQRCEASGRDMVVPPEASI